MRPLASAAPLLAALALAAAAPAPAHAAETEPDPLLPPPGRCAHESDPSAHHRLQRLALHCLLRGVRARAGLPPLRSSTTLRHSATYKARRIAACRVFTHNPCGDALAKPFLEAHVTRRGKWIVGEDLAWGVGDDASPRTIVAAWLDSPTHREVLLDRKMTHVGVRRRRLRMRGAPVGAVVWVAHLGHRAAA